MISDLCSSNSSKNQSYAFTDLKNIRNTQECRLSFGEQDPWNHYRTRNGLSQRRGNLVRGCKKLAWPKGNAGDGLRRRHLARPQVRTLRLRSALFVFGLFRTSTRCIEYVEPHPAGDGAYYRTTLNGWPHLMWLCGVTECVFGKMPERIGVRVALKEN